MTLNSDLNLNRAAEQENSRAAVFNKYFSLLLLYCSAALIASLLFTDFAYSQPIQKIEVKGLYSIPKDELLDLLNISAGKILDKRKVKSGIKRAFLKGIFDDIIVEGLDNDTAIKITVVEKRFIDSIKVRGNEHFSGRFIKKQLSIQKGERLNVLKIKDDIEILRAELKKRGYGDSTVSYSLIPKGRKRVDIVIDITEGKPEVIRKIIISEPEDIVKSYLRLSEGDIFNLKEMERLTEKVTQHYKKKAYIGTALSYSYEEGVLNIRLSRGKRLQISFSNNIAIKSGTLLKEVPFFEANAFSDDLVEETTARIISLYHNHGFPFVQVAPVIEISEDDVSLAFFVFEGERYVVDSIIFEGATMPQERLKEVIALRYGSYHNPELLDSDMESLVEFYHALGYLYVEIQEPEVTMTDNKVAIKFPIKEGPQVKFSMIVIKNNTHIPTNEIMNEIPLKTGNPYNEVDISDAKRKILGMYNNRGFLDSRVTVERVISNTSANITFDIQEGDVTLFGKAVITGNDQTHHQVIRREFTHREDNAFDYSLLLQERQRLYKLGLFTDVEVRLLDKENGKRDVLYALKEANAGAIEFGLGYGEYEKFRGFFDISYKNLWGMNRQASFRTEWSTLEQRFMLSYYEPWFMDKDMALKALALHEDRKEKSIDTGETRYRLRRDSASVGIEKRLAETVKAEIYYDFSVVKTLDVKPDIVLSKEDTGTQIISGIRPGLIYDTRDNPFEPQKGVLSGASLKIAAPVFFSETEFSKLTLFANKYQSLGKRVVLALSMRTGLAKCFGNTSNLPLVERFFLGGRTTVRGYDQDTLGPKSSDGTPIGGNAFAMFNLELRSDIGKGVGIVTFLDGGNVWSKISNMKLTEIKYTTGLGLRYNTPVGPFRLDYGYKLDREKNENSGAIHFSIGHAF